MKKFFEWLKDMLYDSVDYIIMLGIVLSIVAVIGWRLNLLFENEVAYAPPTNPAIGDDIEEDNTPIVDENNTVVSNPDTPIVVNPNVPSTTDPITPPTTPNVEEPTTPSTGNSTVVKVIIPEGSLPSKIGTILQDNQLVSDKSEFVKKSQELSLDTKLKSGSYEIAMGTPIEEIVKIIANKK